MMPNGTAWLCILLWVIQGCQSVPVEEGRTGLDEHTFANLLDTYNHCRNSEDLGELREDMRMLKTLARKVDASSLMPTWIEDRIAAGPSRLAVDPQAMVASCTLRAGEVAEDRGKPEVAAELYRSIVLTYPHPDHVHYVEEALTSLRILSDSGAIQDDADPIQNTPSGPPVTH
ncbi:MAG: hypothetical protein ACT4OO_11490 [Nitrospiraceae bacterium]